MDERELNGWKEIANHLGKAVRTAQRWEQDLDLPVRRMQGPSGEIVSASTSDLDRWCEEAAKTKAGERALRSLDDGDGENGPVATAGTRAADDERSVANGGSSLESADRETQAITGWRVGRWAALLIAIGAIATPAGNERWCVTVPQPFPIIIGGDGLLIAVSASTRVYAIGEAAAK